jgi:hypothetical protein
MYYIYRVVTDNTKQRAHYHYIVNFLQSKKRAPSLQAEPACVIDAITQVISYNHKDQPLLADTLINSYLQVLCQLMLIAIVARDSSDHD